jgi:hypothetical protein
VLLKRSAHNLERGFASEPDLEGERALVQKHRRCCSPRGRCILHPGANGQRAIHTGAREHGEELWGNLPRPDASGARTDTGVEAQGVVDVRTVAATEFAARESSNYDREVEPRRRDLGLYATIRGLLTADDADSRRLASHPAGLSDRVCNCHLERSTLGSPSPCPWNVAPSVTPWVRICRDAPRM